MRRGKFAQPFQEPALLASQQSGPDMFTRSELSIVERTGTRDIDDMLLRRNTHIVVAGALNAGVHRPRVPFYRVDRAAQKIAPAPFLRKSVYLVEKPRCQGIAHKECRNVAGGKSLIRLEINNSNGSPRRRTLANSPAPES